MLRSIFFSAPLLLGLLFVILQQGTVASSTLFLSQITARVSEPSTVMPWIAAFLLSLSLPYIPGMLAVRQMAILKNIAQLRILERLRAAIEGRTTLFAHNGERERRFVFLQREGEDFVTHACDAGFDFTQTLFNVVLNIAALVAVVSPALLPTYAASLLLFIFSVRLTKKPMTEATRAQREARVDFESVRLKTWENLTIGNTINLTRWNSSLSEKYSIFADKRLRLLALREFTSLLSTWAAMIPVFAANLWLFHKASSSAEIALLVATLPRQLMVLNHVHILSNYSGFWHELRERFAGLQRSLEEVDPQLRREHDGRIRFSELKFVPVDSNQEAPSLAEKASEIDWQRWLRQNKLGRFRISGGNGTGKSTLLRSIKETLGAEAFYLPAEHTSLDFPLADGLSSGQRARAILEGLQEGAPRVLLLDEWDANLDSFQRNALDRLISQLSERHLVLEVRHT